MTDLHKLYKDLQSGDYVVADISSNILCPFQFTQTVPATTWYVQHNRNSTNLIVQVYISNKQVRPNNIVYPDGNSIEIEFSIPVVGFANVAVYTLETYCVSLTPTQTVTQTPTITPTQTITPTCTPTIGVTVTPTNSVTPSPTVTPTQTITPTPTVTTS